jgi:3-hydroxyacyl-CoA dehydrogenase/enoyl-CoA hydratase/3-hydroxybutyryl-CoA epimerase
MAWLQSPSLWIQEFTEGFAVLQFDPPGKAVRITRAFQDELESALIAIEKEPRFRALLIRSLKPGRFAHGPDVAGWKAMSAANEFAAWAERGQSLWNRLQGLAIPTIAWVQGSCLGAGLELALACDQIIVVDQPNTALGFAELDLGLIPSWGGYGPLVRRVGLEAAFPLALAGRRVSAREAAAIGLADRLVAQDEPDFRQLFEQAHKRAPALWTRRTWRQKLLEPFVRGRRLLYRGVERLQRRRIPEALPAPGVALKVLIEFVERGTAHGQAAAKNALVELSQSPALANLIRFHELREGAQPTPGKFGVPVRSKTIGILGTTPLGIHLVMEVARREGKVVLRETDEVKLGVSVLKLVQSLNREIQAGKLTPQESQRSLSRIRSTVTWKNFDEVDLVIDTRDRADSLGSDATELDAHVGAKTPIVIVTAAGRLEAAGAAMSHPRRLVGAAAPGPVGTFPVVEWRRTEATDDAAARKVRDWLGGLGWLPLAVGDVPGLLLARLWVPAWNEMVTLAREGAGLESVDQAMIRFGLGRAPFEYLDALGLDHAEKLIEAVREEIEPRIPLDPFWTDVVARGWRGQVSGKGFYRYARGKHQPNPFLVNWLRQEGPRQGPSMPALSKDDQRRFIQDRVILLMANEAFRCLDEHRVPASDDLDLAMMLTDWAPHRGGPIRYARDAGLPVVIARLRELTVHGIRYEPCARLLQESQGA